MNFSSSDLEYSSTNLGQVTFFTYLQPTTSMVRNMKCSFVSSVHLSSRLLGNITQDCQLCRIEIWLELRCCHMLRIIEVHLWKLRKSRSNIKLKTQLSQMRHFEVWNRIKSLVRAATFFLKSKFCLNWITCAFCVFYRELKVLWCATSIEVIIISRG